MMEFCEQMFLFPKPKFDHYIVDTYRSSLICMRQTKMILLTILFNVTDEIKFFIILYSSNTWRECMWFQLITIISIQTKTQTTKQPYLDENFSTWGGNVPSHGIMLCSRQIRDQRCRGDLHSYIGSPGRGRNLNIRNNYYTCTIRQHYR